MDNSDILIITLIILSIVLYFLFKFIKAHYIDERSCSFTRITNEIREDTERIHGTMSPLEEKVEAMKNKVRKEVMDIIEQKGVIDNGDKLN